MKTDIYITSASSKIKFKENKVIVENLDKSIQSFPIESISSIVLFTNSFISTSVYKQIFRKNIPIYFVGYRWDYLWKIESLEATNIELRYKQYKKHFDDNFKLGFSKNIVYYKMENQKRLLKRYRKNYKLKAKFVIDKIQELQNKSKNVDNIDSLRWYEWMASKVYFQSYGSIFSGNLKFTNRNKRPPKDPINSLLSLWYTLLAQTIYTDLKIVGLDVYCGYYHIPKDNRPILVLDMMENWRSLIVDSLIVRLYKQWSINENSFYSLSDENSFYKILLKDDFKKYFIAEYQKRINTFISYPWVNKKITMKEAMKYEWLKLIKYLNWLWDLDLYVFNY